MVLNINLVLHSQFVDDTTLLNEASIREARGIKEVLVKYEVQSGQKMNKDKSCVYFLNTMLHLQ